jgi:hypothetical protein
MEIDIRSINAADLSAPEKEIFSILRESLTSTSDQDTKITDTANRLDQLYPPTGSDEEIETVLWNLWLVMLEIVRLVPADHPWQDILVGALNNLRQRDRPSSNPSIVRPSLDGDVKLSLALIYPQGVLEVWKDLPILLMAIRDRWFGIDFLSPHYSAYTPAFDHHSH